MGPRYPSRLVRTGVQLQAADDVVNYGTSGVLATEVEGAHAVGRALEGGAAQAVSGAAEGLVLVTQGGLVQQSGRRRRAVVVLLLLLMMPLHRQERSPPFLLALLLLLLLVLHDDGGQRTAVHSA